MRSDNCVDDGVRHGLMVAYDLLPRLKNPCPTSVELINEVRGHQVVVDPRGVEPSIDWNQFVVDRKLGGCGGTQWFRLHDGQLLQVELFSGRFDCCWADDWDLGATVRVDDPSENAKCSIALTFNDLADAVEWIGLLNPVRGYPDLLPQPEAIFRVVDERLVAASVSKWPPRDGD